MDFSSLSLPEPIQKALLELGYKKPTPIQSQAIPPILKGRDLMGAAQTGTGKTAAFTLPVLARLEAGHRAKPNQARALILTPTRELALQVGESVARYSRHLSVTTTTVYGGVKINPQMKRLRGGIDILIATPGRLLDLYQHNAIRFNHLEILVLDEADRMLDMGFIHDIKKIVSYVPKSRQTLLFSATFSGEIKQLANTFLNSPIEVSVTPKVKTAKTIKQRLYVVDKKRKNALLTRLIHDEGIVQALVFTKTKHTANKLASYLEGEGIVSSAIHGNKSQNARTKALTHFKEGKIRILVATDIAARGLDIEKLPHVVNFELPHVPEDYVHRIGRTGRAGLIGEAISLVSADEGKLLYAIESLIKKELKREEYDGFYPVNALPKKCVSTRNIKPKKKKKNKPEFSKKIRVKAPHFNARKKATKEKANKP